MSDATEIVLCGAVHTANTIASQSCEAIARLFAEAGIDTKSVKGFGKMNRPDKAAYIIAYGHSSTAKAAALTSVGLGDIYKNMSLKEVDDMLRADSVPGRSKGNRADKIQLLINWRATHPNRTPIPAPTSVANSVSATPAPSTSGVKALGKGMKKLAMKSATSAAPPPATSVIPPDYLKVIEESYRMGVEAGKAMA